MAVMMAVNASRDILPLPAFERALPNGLAVIVVPTGFPNLVSLQIPVQTGSRNEVEPGRSGFAHFFEHMMFRGTRAYPPEKYQAVLTRAGLGPLTLADVNGAIRRHLSAKDLAVVIVTRDAEGLRDRLLADEPSRIRYDAAKPEALLAEDEVIGARKLALRPEAVRITPVEDVFAR